MPNSRDNDDIRSPDIPSDKHKGDTDEDIKIRQMELGYQKSKDVKSFVLVLVSIFAIMIFAVLVGTDTLMLDNIVIVAIIAGLSISGVMKQLRSFFT